MSQEIKVRYGDVEEAISKIDGAADSFETSLEEITGSNELNVVDKLNELSQLLVEVSEAYKQVLKENNQTVRTTLEDMKQVDENLSTSIKAI
ncbi:hypothetical protein CHH83_03270 [Bacillus sp. 7586-K]|uniref:Type VII secretion effector (TIGR04197 family) n=1 Tax=Metabacillus niabensis TaxID=324854 RepID=A0ABT9YVT6_9BACI|nr:DUF5344 family protein [Metabacillus niabensis]MDQ0224113.1 type VII secretion effector (TIGR04197 family) [Metabacillus niabensis]PAD70356.1 hypothetical protein CHH83_03270 [Bacillus sp. 7586-K]